MNKVIINGRFLDQTMTGVQRYALEICRAVDGLITEHDPAVAGLTFEVARPKRAKAHFPFKHIKEARFGRFTGQLWEQLELPLHTKSGPLVNLCNLCPLLAPRNLTVVHDANVWLIRDNYSLAFRTANHVLLPLGIRRSRIWATVSQYSADQLVRLRIANRPPAAIIGSGSDHMGEFDGAPSNIAHDDLPRCYVFALGSRSRNKNVNLIYSLAPDLEKLRISIVVAGDTESKIFTQQGGIKQKNVFELGRVTDADLAYLYRNCLCFLFPSFFEGFGIPPIEAMAMGAPVVSSNTSSLPEILGAAALYCPPDDRSAWIATITELLENRGLRLRLVAQGLAQASNYKWKSTAKNLLQLSRQLLT
jgi:glycosyltransferase involved in cell wall biosynthesis